MLILLESSADSNSGGLGMETLNRIRNVFQRLFRWHRNRGSDERAQRYRLYVENIASLMWGFFLLRICLDREKIWRDVDGVESQAEARHSKEECENFYSLLDFRFQSWMTRTNREETVVVPFHASHSMCDDFIYVRLFWLRKNDRSFSCAYAVPEVSSFLLRSSRYNFIFNCGYVPHCTTQHVLQFAPVFGVSCTRFCVVRAHRVLFKLFSANWNTQLMLSCQHIHVSVVLFATCQFQCLWNFVCGMCTLLSCCNDLILWPLNFWFQWWMGGILLTFE